MNENIFAPCYSSTNFLGQLAWYRRPAAWYRIPRDLGGYLGWFFTPHLHHMQLYGFLPPYISVYSHAISGIIILRKV